MIPTPDYVRLATYYRCRPDLCQGYDPASKGIVENLVGYSKTDLMIPLGISKALCADSNSLVAAGVALTGAAFVARCLPSRPADDPPAHLLAQREADAADVVPA